MSIARAVVFVGSAKATGTSTSEALAKYVGRRLERAGVSVTIDRAVGCRAEAGVAKLADAIAAADLFMLVSPVYVDSLPYLVTRTFEALAAHRASPPAQSTRFASLVHCGFPEAAQCQTAIDITRVFAARAHFEWAGAIALGESGLINGRDPDDLGGVGRQLRAALDAAAAALAAAEPIPSEAVARTAKPFVPGPLYTFVGDLGWKRQAKRNGVRHQLRARPYEP